MSPTVVSLIFQCSRLPHSKLSQCPGTLPPSLPYQSSSAFMRGILRPSAQNSASSLTPHKNMAYTLVHSHFQCLSPEELKEAKKTFLHAKKMSPSQKMSSTRASLLHLIKKDDSTWIPCGDYNHFNMITEPDHYPIPNTADVASNFHVVWIFTKLNLLKVY